MSHHPRIDPCADEQLLELALDQLQSLHTDEIHHPEFLIVHGPAHLGADAGSIHGVERRPLLGIDPVAELIGIEPARDWHAIGVRAPARGHRRSHPDTPNEDFPAVTMSCSLVHLIDRRGTSITVLSVEGSESIRLGPDRTLREGRIADACRRVFALPTAPATDMTAFIVDAWLTLVLRSALLTPGLGWDQVVRLSFSHQMTTDAQSMPATITPADLARTLHTTAAGLDWGRYREVCIALGGCPVSELTAEEIRWMDTGMFARWAHSALPSTTELLDLLEPTLDPLAHDRLWATVSLTERPPSGPPSC